MWTSRLRKKNCLRCLLLLQFFYIFLFLCFITDKWVPFENILPDNVFDSPLDYYWFPPNSSKYIHYKGKYPGHQQFVAPNQTNICIIPKLVGRIKIWKDEPSIQQLIKLYSNLSPGGHGFPLNCRASSRVAVIVPYRNRPTQLNMFLHNMHAILTKQQLDYAIFIVEQVDNQTFNRAKLINVGFVESQKYYDWDCFIFHDVDIIPEDDRNIYKCYKYPRHMSVAVDKFNYNLPYYLIFGGITALKKEHMELINGYSNDYWGWGSEDDDAIRRFSYVDTKISRYPARIARYKMIRHVYEKSNSENTCRFKLIKRTRKRMKKDGLSGLNYKLIESKPNRLYTKIKVDLLEFDSKQKLRQEHPSFVNC